MQRPRGSCRKDRLVAGPSGRIGDHAVEVCRIREGVQYRQVHRRPHRDVPRGLRHDLQGKINKFLLNKFQFILLIFTNVKKSYIIWERK